MPINLSGAATTSLIRQRIVNHVLLLVDASPSMEHHVESVKRQLAELISDLKEHSQVLDQETRITIYAFSTSVDVLVFDTDVLRTPPVQDLYTLMNGMTALNDACAIGIDDMLTTSTVYGDHAFLAYIITDGKENDSRKARKDDVARRISALSSSWTVAAFVPDPFARRYVTNELGVAADNVAMWAANDAKNGFNQASQQIRSATANYMTQRAKGIRSTRDLFSTGSDAVNATTVTQSFDPLAYDQYLLTPVGAKDMRMDELFAMNGVRYQSGRGFYQFTKRESIQPQKQIAIVEKKSNKVYTDDNPGSPAVRALLGLTADLSVRVSPDHNDKYTIFVQSTAPNRKVLHGTKVLMMKN